MMWPVSRPSLPPGMMIPTLFSREDPMRPAAITRKSSGIAAAVLAIAMSLTASQAADPVPQSFTYKQVGELEIKADVYNAAPGESRPVLVWIHGGALIGGNRTSVDRRIKKAMLDAGP